MVKPGTQPKGGGALSGESRRAARSAQLTVVFLGIYLVVVFFSGLALVRYVTQTQDQFVPDYLTLVGRTITDPPREYNWPLQFITDPTTGMISDEDLADYRESINWDDIELSLKAAGREHLVQTAHLLTPRGEIIMDKDGIVPPPGERGVYMEKEAAAIAEAAAGRVYTTPVRARPRIRPVVYVPVRYKQVSGEEVVVALLRLEGEGTRLLELQRLRNRLFFGFWASIGVLAFLYLAIVQLVRRTIQAERMASQSDRLRALGTMTAGVAHEIRNPLGILMLQVEELRASLRSMADRKAADDLDHLVREIQEEAGRLKRLTEQFVYFGGAGADAAFSPMPIDVATTLRATVRLWQKGVDSTRREVNLRVPDDLPPALFTEDRLRQVILNLLRNADDALGPDHGRLDIEAHARSGLVVITVTDDGPGMDAATVRQVFDPFFTTKAEGTGLGLSLSRALAQSAGGDLTVESAPGRGACFTLSLRVVAES